MTNGKLRVNFIALWAALLIVKLALATSLPLFVDEAFYAWEARYPAWAYSDLPGLTAFLIGLGQGVFGSHELALRLPFIAIGSAVPWLVVIVARRWFGQGAGWWAGLLSLLMPLSGLLGVLALPDVMLVFSALLCLDAIARLRERWSLPAAIELAFALSLGALAHYRFGLVIVAGLAGLLLDARGRDVLRDRRVWPALLTGLLAWLPLLAWNLDNAGAGVRFQLIERNPWTFHADAASWLPMQALLLTPMLFALLCATFAAAVARRGALPREPWSLLAGIACISVAGYFVLGFFVDDQRVSFHWPLPGWLALTVAAPVLLMKWSIWSRVALVATSAAGLLAGVVFLSAAAVPGWRSALAATRAYPADFAGWPAVTDALRSRKDAGTSMIIASDFELGAQLAFALGRRDIHVLDSPLNHKHGRAAQLQAWRLVIHRDPREAAARPVLLVVDDTATPLKLRLARSHGYCELFGQLPTPTIVQADRGRKRYLVYALDGTRSSPGCTAPALAWIDSPAPKARVSDRFAVTGWAFKDGPGIDRIEVTLDGKPVANARYGIAMPHVMDYWKISSDPNQPRVGFSAELDLTGLPAGEHWLGLVIHGADGSVEPWPEQLVRTRPP